MKYWTFNTLKTFVREVTGRFSPIELTQEEVGLAINKYYQLTFPMEVKLDSMEDIYMFFTSPNVGLYPLPWEDYINFLPPAWCNHNKVHFSQWLARDGFSRRFQYTSYILGEGDGTRVEWNFTLGTAPVAPNTFIMQTPTASVTDTNREWSNTPVTLTGDGGGSLSYLSGVGAVTFAIPPAVGEKVEVSYSPFKKGKPDTIVMFDNHFHLFPVPDKVYRMEITAYKGVAPLVNATDTPLLEEWGWAISYGAAKEILARYGEMEGYAEVSALHRESLIKVYRRTQENIRIKKPFSYF